MTTRTPLMAPAGRPSIAHSIVHSLLGTTGGRILGAVGGLLAARLLGPTLRGEYALVLVIATVASLLATCGLQFWIATEVAREGSAAHVRRTVVSHSVAIVAALIVLGAIASPLIMSWIDVDGLTVATMILYSATNAIGMLVVAAPGGARDMRRVALSLTGGSAAFALGMGALVVADRPTVAWVMIAATVGNLVAMAIALPSWLHRTSATGRSGEHDPAPGITATRTAQQWAYAVRLHLRGGLGEVVLLSMLRVDFLVLAAFRPVAEVGLYAVATSLTELLWIAPDATAQVVLPLAAEKDGADAVPRIFRVTLLVVLIAGVGLSLVGPWLVPFLFGSDYSDASRAIPFLAIAAVGAGAWKVLAGDVAARGRTSTRLSSSLAGLAAMLLADIIFIPLWGIVGAAGASAIGYLVSAAYMERVWQRLPTTAGGPLWRLRRADFSLGRTGNSPARRTDQ